MDQVIFTDIESGYDRFLHNLGHWFSDHGYEIILILFVAWLVKKYGTKLLMQLLQKTVCPDLYPTKSDREKRLRTLDSLIDAVLKVAVVVVAGIMIIAELGLNTTPVIASAGIIGVALGFGAQSLIKDLTSGLFIIMENQYRVGDVIELNDQIKGQVEAITIRTTIIRSLDGTLFHVPNGTISWTANKTMGFGGIEEDIVFSNDVNIEKLAIVINKVGQRLAEDPEYAKKIKKPLHFERVVGFDANGIKVKIIGTTSSDDSWLVKGVFYKELIKELRKANIDIPYMQVTVHKPTTSKS